MTTLSFSATSVVLPLRRIPAVSTKRYARPSRAISVSTLSMVVPGMGETMERSSPTMRFSSVDLPTLGRPMMATSMLSGCFSSSPDATTLTCSSAPFSLAVDAVAGDARLIGDDSAARAGQTVEERGLAHVGATDDNERWEQIGHRFLSSALYGCCRASSNLSM